MSTSCIDINNNISYINYINESSPFMIEYYNKRMKLWTPYADIPLENDTPTQNNLDILIKAIDYIEKH